MVTQQELEFYATPGRMTDLASVDLGPLPTGVADVCSVVQGLMIHPFWLDAYGVSVPDERQTELQIRPAAGIVEKIRELDEAPLTDARPPERRILGNCRDFSTLTTALLRRRGVPARARCGFGLNFAAGEYIDHWVVERWDGRRWVLTDAQLDETQCRALEISFDPLDTPRDVFVDAGRAWKRYREGEVGGDRFGVLDMRGPEFIRGNIARDAAALNKVELLPWDAWGVDDRDAANDEFYDRVAPITAKADFEQVRELYETDERVRVPDEITSYWPQETRVRL